MNSANLLTGVNRLMMAVLISSFVMSFFLVLAPSKASAQIGYGRRWHPEKVELEAEALSATQVNLVWRISNQTQEYYGVRIYRADPLTPLNMVFITQLAGTAVSFNDSGLKPNASYNYQIRFVAKKPVVLSVPSNVANAKTMDPNGETSAPTTVNVPRYTSADPGVRSAIKTLSAKALASNRIQLAWGMPYMAKVASLRIFRADPENPTEFIFLDAVGANQTKYVDQTVYPKKTYTYVLKYNAQSHSALLLSSNAALATTPDGANPTVEPKYNRTNVIETGNPAITNNIQGMPVVLQPTYYNKNIYSSALPLDSREQDVLDLINKYRAEKGLGPVRPSISLTRSADALAQNMVKTRSFGRNENTKMRAREMGYDINTQFGTVTIAARSYPDVFMEQLMGYGRDKDTILNPVWKTVGIARDYDEQAGEWYFVLDFSAFWDFTVQLPGEDEEGRIDGNDLVRTRPPAEGLAKGHFFTGYGDDGKPYSDLHCDSVTKACWKDPMISDNKVFDELSDPDFLVGDWSVNSTVSPTGITHFNDKNGYDMTEFTMNLRISKDGTWISQGYRAYQRPTPVEAGTWKAVYDASTNEAIVTFYRDGYPTAKVRVHAAKGRLTFFAVDGGAEMKDFFKSGPAGYLKAGDNQVIFKPGFSFLLGPYTAFPANARCSSCPR